MKKVVIALLLSIVNCQLSICQIGTWHNYLAYHDIQQIQAAGDELFVMASNDLYQYNKQDQSIVTYDKVNGLSDTYITQIKWCQQAKRLVIVYSNSNIDLLQTNSSVTNISDIYSKAITGDKTINSIYIDGQYAYLACGFGIVKLNVKDAEISESYMLGFPVTAITISNGILYAQSKNNGVWQGFVAKNLIDPSNWTKTTSAPSFNQDTSDYDNNIELVKTLKVDGPDYNSFFESKFVNGKLYTTGGAFRSGFIQLNNPGIVQIYDGNDWIVYPTNITNTTGFNYQDINCIDVDPTDNNHVMVGGRCGLYEFQNGVLKAYYYKDNSPLKPVTSSSSGQYLPDDYTLIHGVKFDSQGNLWVVNSQAKGINLLLLNKNGQWTTLTKNELYYSQKF